MYIFAQTEIHRRTSWCHLWTPDPPSWKTFFCIDKYFLTAGHILSTHQDESEVSPSRGDQQSSSDPAIDSALFDSKMALSIRKCLKLTDVYSVFENQEDKHLWIYKKLMSTVPFLIVTCRIWQQTVTSSQQQQCHLGSEPAQWEWLLNEHVTSDCQGHCMLCSLTAKLVLVPEIYYHMKR